MKTKIFTFAILSILLLGAIAVAEDNVYVGTEADSQKFNLFSYFAHIFGTNQFSVVGDYRQCERYASEEYRSTGGSFTINAADYCSSGYGLIDLFNENWVPLREYRDTAQITACSTCKYIAEVYCCDHKECTSDSNCESWYGVGSECITRTADDPNIPYNYNTFKYCSEPSGTQVTCWYYPNSGSSCQSRTYIGDTYCPSTYMGYNLYASKSNCESNIPSSICSNGLKDGDETGVDCGGSCPACAEIQPIEVTNMIIPDSLSFFNTITSKQKFYVTLKNTDSSMVQTVKVEAGYYTPSYARNVAQLYSSFNLFATINPIANCVADEEFVKTKEVTLNPGETTTVVIEQSPIFAYITMPKGEYILANTNLVSFLGVYKSCCQPLTTGGCAPGTGGYIDYTYNTGWTSREFSGIGKEYVTCDGTVYGTIDYNLKDKTTLTITKDYTDCITRSFTAVNSTGSGIKCTKDLDCGIEGKFECNLLNGQCLEKITTNTNITTGFTATQTSLQYSELSQVTSSTIMASTCSVDSNCLPYQDISGNSNYTVKCLANTVTKDKITAASKEVCSSGPVSLFNFKTLLTSSAAACLGSIAITVYGSPLGAGVLTAPATYTICASVVGSAVALGSTVAALESGCEIWKQQSAQGICIATAKNPDFFSYFQWAAFFDITQDGIKNGTDGLILVAIVVFVVLIFFRR